MPRNLYPSPADSARARKAAVTRAENAEARRAFIARYRVEHNRFPTQAEIAAVTATTTR